VIPTGATGFSITIDVTKTMMGRNRGKPS